MMPGNSHGDPFGQRAADVVLLGADGVGGLGAERDELFDADLGVVEAQARPAGAVVDDRVEREHRRVAAADAGLHQQHHEVPDASGCAAGPGCVGILELGHDELGDELAAARPAGG